MSLRLRLPATLLCSLLLAAGAACQQPSADVANANADTTPATTDAVTPDQEAAVQTEIDADTLLQRMADDEVMLVLDVRTAEEFAAGHVPGAVNISHDELGARLDEVRAHGDVDIILYCRSGRRAGVARTELEEAGFSRLMQLQGDMNLWQERNLPVEIPGDGS